MIFLVFKSTAAAEDAEWEDDPIPGELWVKPLEDDDTEEYEPAKSSISDRILMTLSMWLARMTILLHSTSTGVTVR